ncbi:MAG: radical SAM protein [Nanoarchaeota archaeon]|nr:radical SAM protein [Nanoarchaeota archaeon]MBU4242568.1 radical SAM protein [Nanoarchaeota archaeon]MBU4352236.1 radical SAM protein [Nanoarchaeota archaeon]MBU4456639.1 radical SAM protein [Nanoarchaeota archaeon]MCG2719193.1 radical SAM protein [Nanoarchaeota archaeon]
MKLIKIDRKSEIPLIGCIAFGIIDRGTDLIQIRPTSVCNMKCIFCSTNANDPNFHPTNYQVELDYLLDYVKEVVKFKEVSIEANIDSVGEVATYPQLIELIKGIKKIKEIRRISMQTNGMLINDVKVLEEAGLNQINLSINSLDKEQAKTLSGCQHYDLNKILKLAEEVSKSKIQLLFAPVWIPKWNDKHIPELIKLAKKLKAKIGIQKYEEYKHSRKAPNAKKINYKKFYEQLKEWEKEYKIDLICTADNFNIKKAKRLPTKFKIGEKTIAEIKASGWMINQALAVANNRCITINNCQPSIGKRIKVKITDNKNNIYMAEKIK